MKTIVKVTGILLITVVIFLSSVAGLIYSDRKYALELAVAMLSDMQISIDGDFTVGFSNWTAVVQIQDAQLLNPDQNQPLLTIGKLEAEIQLNHYSFSFYKLNHLSIYDLVAHITRYDDGSLNWPASSPKTTEGSQQDFDWDVLIGSIYMENVEVLTQGFVDQQQQLVISTLALSALNKATIDSAIYPPRKLSLTGQINQLPFNLSTKLNNLAPFILDRQPLTLDLSGTIDVINFTARGLLGEDDNKTNLQLSITAPSLEILGVLIDDDIPNFGQLSASTHIVESNGGYSLNQIEFSVTGGPAEVGAIGGATIADNKFGANLDVKFSSADISGLTNTAALEDLSLWHGEWQSRLDLNDDVAVFRNSKLLLTNQSQGIESDIDQLVIYLNDFSATKMLVSQAQIQYQHVDATGDNKWRYLYQADTISASINEKQDIQLETNGRYKGVDITATALWKNDRSFNVSLALNQLQAKFDGTVNADEALVRAKIQLPSLEPLSLILGAEVIPIDPSEISFDLLINNKELSLGQLDMTLAFADSTIKLASASEQAIRLNDFAMDVLFKTDSLTKLDDWLNTYSVSINQTYAALITKHSYAVERGGLSSSDFDITKLLDLVDLDAWQTQYPALITQAKLAFTVSGKADGLRLKARELRLLSDLADIRWLGDDEYSPNLFDLNGELTLDLEPGAVKDWVSAVSLKMELALQNDTDLMLKNIHIIADKTEVEADLSLRIDDGIQNVEGSIDFKFLDLSPFFPNDSLSGGNTAAVTTPVSDGSLLFSTDELALALPFDTTTKVTITAQAIQTPWLDTEEVQATVQYSDAGLSLDLSKVVIGDGTIFGTFVLAHKHDTPRLSLLLQADQLDPDRISVLRNYDVVRSGSLDGLLELQTQGSSLQSLAENMNGKVSVVTRNAMLNGDDLAQIAPEVLTQLNRKLNPLYKKGVTKDTELQCGVMHFDVANGLLLADKSIVLVTADMVFGAHGAIDLGKNTLRMQVAPKARKGLGISLVGSAAKLALIAGSVSNPRLKIDSKGALTSVGLDVAGTALYGPLYWIYQGQIQKLLASPKTCETTIARVAPRFKPLH